MNTMKKIVSAAMFCAVLSWPIQGMAQTQQEKDKIATANTHVVVNGGSGLGTVRVESKGATTDVSADKNAQTAIRNHAAGVANSVDKAVEDALKKDAEEQRAAAKENAGQAKNSGGQNSSNSPNNNGK
ncbi:MAG: hypothetical protein Q4E32_07335 [Bacteroidales bacterium]|nr:hypothetical protein [Bacteroidales bacterium]